MRANVRFDSSGLKLAAHFYVPDGQVADGRPAVVVSPSLMGVKEQTAGTYASRLAAAGFVALAFDAAFQGESEGDPHLLEDPAHRVEDIKNAVTFLSQREEVDAERIGALGICASGGYVVSAAATDHRIKAVATVSATDIGSIFREGIGRGQDPSVIQRMLATSGVARTEEGLGKPARLLQIYPDSAEEIRSMGRYDYEAWEYYRTTRGQHARSENYLVFRSIDLIAQYQAFNLVGLLSSRPLLMIAGTEAPTSYFSVETIERAREPKELFWVNGASHVDLFDKEQYLPAVVEKLCRFFETQLGGSESADDSGNRRLPQFA